MLYDDDKLMHSTDNTSHEFQNHQSSKKTHSNPKFESNKAFLSPKHIRQQKQLRPSVTIQAVVISSSCLRFHTDVFFATEKMAHVVYIKKRRERLWPVHHGESSGHRAAAAVGVGYRLRWWVLIGWGCLFFFLDVVVLGKIVLF